jgi:hypothetical protein
MSHDGVALGFIPVDLEEDGRFVRWRFDEHWPR